MTTHQATSPQALQALLQLDGFAFVTGPTMQSLLAASSGLDDWPAFAASWNELGPDTYLAAKGRHRRRRHAVFSAGATGEIRREPDQPHYQSLDYNNLQGGIERWFEPMLPAIADGPSLRRILGFSRDFFGMLAPTVRQWRIEVHQFRIEARADAAGEPTPEGVHRDGVDYVLVLLIDRENIECGTTTIHKPDGELLGSFTLTHPLDAAVVDDARICHGVTPVTPLDPQRTGHRDVLVVTFRKAPAAD
ncbi:2OG-Fe dioxygenase family protein [Dyella subtropica]|uniref:2OG-Fe dioxygenase family protein n=1 Tax=Dyella subtropica TaxID=2992127 RepID=UPI0022562D19|nr:2OG-Fe dioxygenase family protein [Dyella subtropica]